MPCEELTLRYRSEPVGRYVVESADMISTIGEASVRVLCPRSEGGEAVVWSEYIRIASEPGFPVMHDRYDGHRVCYGGPSHPFRDMAQRRAADLLDGRIEEARSYATARAMDAAVAARKALREGGSAVS